MATMGQPGKAGKTRQDAPAARPRGRTILQRIGLVPVTVRQAEPIGTALMASLAIAQNTSSPMGGARGFVTHATGAGLTGRNAARQVDDPQHWQGAGAPIARDSRSVLGAQGGPSSQPAFPSTGSSSMINPLTGMPTPYGLTTPAVS